MNIYEHHEVLGWFFLPEDKDNPEKWVPGVLKWDPAKGTEIELMGGLFPGFYYEVEQNGKSFPSGEVSGVVRPADDVSPIPAMFLQTTKGNRYSIFNAQRGNYSAGPFTTRNNEEHWHSTQVYVGDHVVPEEKIFTKATFYIDELYYLVNQVCQPKDDFQAGIFEGNTEDAHYSIKLPETRQLKHQRYGLEFTISVEASVSITLRNQKEVEELAGRASNFVSNFAPIRDLMRLATFQPCGVYCINLKQKDEDNNQFGSLLNEVGLTSDDVDPHPANIGHLLIKPKFGEIARPHERHNNKKVVFTLDDISLENFLKERERLTSNNGASDYWDILIALCGYSPNYIEEYMNQSYSAAEGFHEQCLNGGDVLLKERFKNLYSRLPQEVQGQINFNANNWAELAKNARHRVSHGRRLKPDDFTTSFDRYAVAVSVHLVTYLVVLNELGVPSEKICGALLNHPKILLAMSYCDKVRSMLES